MRNSLWAQLLLLLSVTAYPPMVHAQPYVSHLLTSLPGAYASASDINDSGQIVGTISGGSPWKGRAVLWDDYSSGPQSLDEENPSANADLINNMGLIIGSHSHPLGYSNPFSYAGGSVTNLDWFPVIEAVNDSGTMIGWRSDSGVVEVPVVISNAGQVADLESVCGGSGEAVDINNLGYIVGTSYYADRWGGHATIWHAGEAAIDLGTFGGTWSTAMGISNHGQVVGVYGGDDGTIGNFIWSLTGQTIFTPRFSQLDSGYFGPIDINDKGVVLGNAEIDGVDTVVTWSQTDGLTIVGTGIANAINNSGWIVGISDYNDSQALVWEPVPEPSSLLALIGGLGCMVSARRRRRP